jgi:3-deoxy-D-manno-octulosonic-acid transferase
MGQGPQKRRGRAKENGWLICFAPPGAFPANEVLRAMLWLYRLLFVPALVLMGPAYLLRMRRRGGYGADFGQRFGAHPRLPPRDPGRPRIWMQAVSVGEILAIGPLLEALRRDGLEVYLTTTTSTGRALARERYAGLTVGIGYFPLDWWPCVARAWRRIDPDLLVLVEGERWPETLHQAAARGVPVLNINARVSDRSFARLRRFPAVARLALGGFSRVLCGSEQDRERVVACGVPAERAVTTGNLKLDVSIPLLDAAARARLREELGLADGPVLLGSSTWPGEEEALLVALGALRAAGIACSLLLVPRHAERRDEVRRLLAGGPWRHHFRSEGRAAGPVDVAVGDTTGELRRLTQLAEVVFVGKSLAPHTEGQTPVEAAVLGRPILLGPGMANFRAIAADLRARGAAREVRDAAELAAAAAELFREPARREKMSSAAGRWHGENSGAVARTLALIHAEIAARAVRRVA